MPFRNRRGFTAFLILTIVAFTAAACGSDDGSPAATSTRPPATPNPAPAVIPTSVGTPTATTAPTATPVTVTPTAISGATPTSVGTSTATPTPQAAETTPAAQPFVWQIEEIDRGTKPALALTRDGTPHVAFMLEAQRGFVKSAERAADGWDIATLAEGYFYGPLDIGIGGDDRPQVVYHDHQAARFDPNLGDAALAARTGGEWRTETLEDGAHDGWDTRIFVGADGVAHVSAIDPKEFDGAGVEYYRVGAGGELTVEQIGSGQQTYKYATSVAVDSNGTPYLTYYDQKGKAPALAARTDSGWEIGFVDSQADTGLFASLLIDSADRFHISYFKRTTSKSETIKYATRGKGESDWTISEVGELKDLIFGFEGARNITSIQLDGDGNPVIAYSDTSNIKVARWNGSGWDTETLTTLKDRGREFGQLVSLKLDGTGRAHLTWFEVTKHGPLDGVVMYALGTPG